MELTKEQINAVKEAKDKAKAAMEKAGTEVKEKHNNIWTTLQNSENVMVGIFEGKQPGENVPGNYEYGPILYILNNDVYGFITDTLKDVFDMPKSTITKAQWDKYVATINAKGYVAGDGTLIQSDAANEQYGAADYLWAIALFEYLINDLLEDSFADFGINPAEVVIPCIDKKNKKKLKVVIIGDWGTGIWKDGGKPKCPSQLVMEQVKSMDPDVVIHLGDVYYAGTEKLTLLLPPEESGNFTDVWDSGTKMNFTLNSNHEMYNGGKGYFHIALNPKNLTFFANQNQTSFFSLEFGQWLILGLDSAYYDPSTMFMDGALWKGDKPEVEGEIKQHDFIKKAVSKGKKIIAMTHHNPINTDGQGTPKILWDQLMKAMGGTNPDYWYWGHIHNGIVYTDKSVAGGKTKCRCSGHAAIPFGDGHWLGDSKSKGLVEYYANTPMQNPDANQENRVLNGFAVLTLSENDIKEEFYVTGNSSPVWSK